jgi:hypothetical protein
LNPEPRCCSQATLNWIGVVGAFVVMIVLVAALKRYTRVPGVDLVRAGEREAMLAEVRQQAAVDLTTAAWIDREKGVVRLPNEVAMELFLKQAGDPASARLDLFERADKAFFVPPPPPEPPSEFE